MSFLNDSLFQEDPVKTWGASNAENEANYGGVSGFNLKKPSMQQDLGWLGWVGLVGWGGKQSDFAWWNFIMMSEVIPVVSLGGEIPWFQIRLDVVDCCHKVHGKNNPTFQTAIFFRLKIVLQQPLCLVKIHCNQWSAGDSVWWLHCYGIITNSHELMTPTPVEPCCILKKVAISRHFGPSLHVNWTPSWNTQKRPPKWKQQSL